MISRTSLHNMYRKEYKSNLALFGIMIFVLFCSLPFSLISLISNYENRFGVDFRIERSEYLFERNFVINNFLYENTVLMVVIGGFAIFTGIFLFQFLHSRQKTDFYFSMPVKRSSLFWCKYLQGIIYVAIAMVVNMLIVFAVAAYKNCISSVFVFAMLQKIITFMLYFVALYSITIIAVLVTGKTFFSFLGACTLSAYFPAFVFMLEIIFNSNAKRLLKGAYNIYKLSPLTLLLEIFEKGSNYHSGVEEGVFLYSWNIKALIGMAIFAFAFMALSYWLFLKRPAEAAGKTIIYAPFKKVVKLFLVFAFAVGMSWLLPEMLGTSGTVYMVLSFIAGTLFSIYILDALIELNFLAALKNWKKQWIYVLVCCIGLTCGYVYSDSIKYHGFEDIPSDYTEAEAIKDGFVIFTEQEECHNKELLLQFEKDVMDGKDAKLRIARSSNNEVYAFIDLIYENGYISRYNEYDLFSSSKYKYFVPLEDEINPEETWDAIKDATKCTDFYLSDSKTLTKDYILNGKFSEESGQNINYEYVCSLYE